MYRNGQDLGFSALDVSGDSEFVLEVARGEDELQSTGKHALVRAVKGGRHMVVTHRALHRD